MKHTLLISALAAILCIAGCTSSENDFDRVHIGEQLPEFTAITGMFGNSTVSISSADFAGKKGLIVFFTTTCPDCKREMPKIEQVWQNLRGEQNVVIAAISRGNSPQQVADYWTSVDETYSKVPFSMPYYFDHDRALYGKFAESGVPRVYMIDSQGVIRRIIVENVPYDAEELTAMLEELE